jgi:hypothetical protein
LGILEAINGHFGKQKAFFREQKNGDQFWACSGHQSRVADAMHSV